MILKIYETEEFGTFCRDKKYPKNTVRFKTRSPAGSLGMKRKLRLRATNFNSNYSYRLSSKMREAWGGLGGPFVKFLPLLPLHPDEP